MKVWGSLLFMVALVAAWWWTSSSAPRASDPVTREGLLHRDRQARLPDRRVDGLLPSGEARVGEGSGAGATRTEGTHTGDPSDPSRPVTGVPEQEELCLLLGSLRDREANPLSGSVRFLDADGRQRTWILVQDGRFSLAGLADGTWRAIGAADGHREATLEFDITSSEEPLTRIEFVLEPAFLLEVQLLTPEGDPLLPALHALDGRHRFAGAIGVTATSQPPGVAFPSFTQTAMTRSERGRWRPARFAGDGDQADGVLEIDGEPPTVVSVCMRQFVVESRELTERVERVVFEIDPERVLEQLSGLRLQTVDAITQDPIPATVAIDTSQRVTPGRETDARGRIELVRELPGLLDLVVHAEGYASHHDRIVMPPGEVVDLGRLPLHAPVPMDLAFVLPTGSPARVGVRFSRYDPDRPGHSFDYEGHAHHLTDDRGHVDASRLPPGLWLVTLNSGTHGQEPEWWAPPFVLDLRTRAPVARRTPLQATVPLLLVGAVDRSALLLASDGLPVERLRLREGEAIPRKLVPGNYSLILDDADGGPIAFRLPQEGTRIEVP